MAWLEVKETFEVLDLTAVWQNDTRDEILF